MSEESKRKISESNKGKSYPNQISPMKRKDISDEYILKLFNSGISCREIAQKVGMKSHKGVSYRLKK